MKSFFIAIGLFSFLSLNAQNKYVKLGGGYNFSLNSELLTDEFSETYTYTPNYKTMKYETSYNKSDKGVYGSFGKGLNFNITGGINLNEKFAFELGINYIKSTEYQGKHVITERYSDMGYVIQQTTRKSYVGRMFSLTPALVFQTELNKKYNCYFKLGMILGKGWYNGETEYYLDQPAQFPDTIINRKFEFTGGFSLGTIAAIGIIKPLADNLSFYSEINIISLSFSPTGGQMTEYKINGIDNMSKATANEKSVEYSDEINFYSSTEKTQPTKNLSQPKPFSSWGINIGLIYTIGKKA